MCCWWVTDCSPMYVTALLPLVLFPLMGILSASEVAKQYVDSLSFIQLGGAMVALALARWGLQQRMALFAMSKVASLKERYLSLPKICYEEIVVLVDFCALAILFMFRSDIDFGVFVLPGWGRVFPKNFANDSTVAILCGGIMYLIPGRRSYTAAQRHTPSSEDRSQYDRASLEEPLSAESNVGSANSVELRELPTDHVALDILPHTSEQAPELSTSLVMQRPLINETMHTTQRDPSSCCTLQHCTPRIIYKKLFSWADTKILDADSFKELPWDVIILLGGGLALAQGLNASGLGSWFGSLLNDLQGVPLWVLVLIASLMTKALTEITVNVAAATILLPVVASLAIATGTEPLVLMIPATLCASFAFMLPTACASNLIVFSSRKLQIHGKLKAHVLSAYLRAEMLLWGSFLSLLCIGILTLVSILGEGWLGWSFGLSSLSTSGSISSSSTSSIFLRE
ncbi:SLC13/DASS family transporter [Pelomyxa schiedti]|nr:SLC13/DASS family transporter [Pelomyxa schiedti]